MIHRFVMVALAISVLGGCALGRTKYQCPAPTGAACMPVKSLYELTDAPGREGLEAATGLVSEDSVRAAATHRGDSTSLQNAVPAGHALARTTPQPGTVVPIRQAAKIMRIWVAPWEDTAGNLHMASRVFAEIAAPRWAFGSHMWKKAKRLYPLQIEDTPKSSGTTPGDGVVAPAG